MSLVKFGVVEMKDVLVVLIEIGVKMGMLFLFVLFC